MIHRAEYSLLLVTASSDVCLGLLIVKKLIRPRFPDTVQLSSGVGVPVVTICGEEISEPLRDMGYCK